MKPNENVRKNKILSIVFLMVVISSMNAQCNLSYHSDSDYLYLQSKCINDAESKVLDTVLIHFDNLVKYPKIIKINDNTIYHYWMFNSHKKKFYLKKYKLINNSLKITQIQLFSQDDFKDDLEASKRLRISKEGITILFKDLKKIPIYITHKELENTNIKKYIYKKLKKSGMLRD